MSNGDQRGSRWIEITREVRELIDEKLNLEKKMRDEFIKSHTQEFVLPAETDLNWREPIIVIKMGLKNEVVIEMQETEFHGILNGRNSKRHPKGAKFIILKKWKKGKTKGTHYLLYDKKTKRVANFYG
ncbi:MAG: hypothetical protein EBZ48_15020 [Proteobacteria bacterium]|nr:hypothetical protein [Pseudomonadota bacterium]